jgi:hypothetical protein
VRIDAVADDRPVLLFELQATGAPQNVLQLFRWTRDRPATGRWSHLAITHGPSGRQRLYVDGDLVRDDARPFAAPPPAMHLKLLWYADHHPAPRQRVQASYRWLAVYADELPAQAIRRLAADLHP